MLTVRMPGAHRPYARCSPSVCPVLTARMSGAYARMPGTWETFTQIPESGNAPSPCIADEQSI
ncbi:hypothetical protein [Bacteroides salyersiae]|uniref:hypothetical protein n=1 Tax=Bacteroides salyersiae TaxID=291644 RepID=UPI001C8C5354|nr:hypothetical protein [Bacteroides salyersiae]